MASSRTCAVEQLIHKNGFEVMRLVLQGHLDERARQEPDFDSIRDGTREHTHKRKNCSRQFNTIFGKNRNCPKCGNDDATKWLAARKTLLLPVQHFLVTSTLPAELRRLARSNQKLIYGLLLRCTAEAVQKLARDSKWVGGDIGFHVHAHFIVPGGGISPDGKRWLPAQREFLMPERAVATILRGKPVWSRAFDRFRDALKKTSGVVSASSQQRMLDLL